MATIPRNPADPFQSMRGNINLIVFVIRTWSTSIEVFFRHDFGNRYLGYQAMAVLVLLPLFSLGWQGYNLRPLFWFLAVYLLRCFYVRQRALLKRWRGAYWHSYYNGRPSGLKRNAKIDERKFKLFVEPVLAFGVGWMLWYFGEAPLGTYWMWGGVCMFLSSYLIEAAERTQLMNMHDSVIEQELLAQRFRQMRGDP